MPAIAATAIDSRSFRVLVSTNVLPPMLVSTQDADRADRLLDGAAVVAQHVHSFGHRQKVELPEHRAEIVRRKQGAAASTGGGRLRAAAPDIGILFERWVEAGRNVGSMTARTTKLLDLYGQDIFAKAIAETIERGTHDPGEVGVLCEKYRRATEHPVPVHVLSLAKPVSCPGPTHLNRD